jgi:iron complex outermembrane receptor protein
VGLYIQDEWKVIPKLTLVAGLRFDMDTFINPTYSPRFSAVFKPIPNHTFRAGISVAYRPPTIFETSTLSQSAITVPVPFPPFSIQAQGVLFGSENLDPEQIISYEVGYQGWYWNHRIKLRADLFYNHISNLISFGIIPSSNNTQSTFSNGGTPPGSPGGEVDIYGGEAGVEFLVTPWLSGFANYAYQDINQTYSSTSRVQRAGPRFKVNGGVRLDFLNGLNGEAVLHYIGAATYPIDPSFAAFFGPTFGTPIPDQRIGSYFLLNLRGGYRFWKDKAEIAITAFNALNDKHQEHPLGETIGSRVMGWLTIKY